MERITSLRYFKNAYDSSEPVRNIDHTLVRLSYQRYYERINLSLITMVTDKTHAQFTTHTNVSNPMTTLSLSIIFVKIHLRSDLTPAIYSRHNGNELYNILVGRYCLIWCPFDIIRSSKVGFLFCIIYYYMTSQLLLAVTLAVLAAN